MDDLTPSSYDSVIRLYDYEIETLQQVDDWVIEAVEQGNPNIAFEHGRRIRRARQVEGLALAKLLYEMEALWNDENTPWPSDDDFVDVARDRLGYSSQTIKKYIKVWREIFAAPKYLLEDESVVIQLHDDDRFNHLLEKPIEALYGIATAVEEGQLEEGHWEEIEMAPNKEAILDVRRKVRKGGGGGTKRLIIALDRDGTLKRRRNNTPYKPIGFLNLELEDEISKAAIRRLINGAGIIEL